VSDPEIAVAYSGMSACLTN